MVGILFIFTFVACNVERAVSVVMNCHTPEKIWKLLESIVHNRFALCIIFKSLSVCQEINISYSTKSAKKFKYQLQE